VALDLHGGHRVGLSGSIADVVVPNSVSLGTTTSPGPEVPLDDSKGHLAQGHLCSGSPLLGVTFARGHLCSLGVDVGESLQSSGGAADQAQLSG
jgi:hypothetical protein